MFFNKNNKLVKKSTLIVSPAESRLTMIEESLSVRGVVTESLRVAYDKLQPKHFENKEALVIDLGDITESQIYIKDLLKITPRDLTCVIFANSDSIKIAQDFINHGYKYLNFESQFQELYGELVTEQAGEGNSIKIAILGTKGGVGASFIAANVANTIFARYKTRTLLVQGAYSSFNVDLFFDRSFTLESHLENEISLYRELDPKSFGFEKFMSEKFNFIVYDQLLQSFSAEEIEQSVNTVDCALVVINSELASIRKAKEILEVNDMLLSVNQGAKKILLVLNEVTRNVTLGRAEIEQILNCKIDFTIPFSKSARELKIKPLSSIEHLTSSLILGNATKKRFSLLRK